MEYHQTVDCPQNGTPGCWATVWCASTNFNFKILLILEKNFLSPNIPKNHQKIYKTARNINMWDEWRDS